MKATHKVLDLVYTPEEKQSINHNAQTGHDTALAPVSGQLPPLQVTDEEYKKLMKALYLKDRSKKLRR